MTENSDEKEFRVVKCESNTFTLDGSGERISAVARKKFKFGGGIVVGDFVRLESENGERVISEVLPRKNYLIRPLSANIDQLVILVAPVPAPDFFLIDKLIINARRQEIDVALCLNKSDLPSDLLEELRAQYSGVADSVIAVSAKCGDLEQLRAVLRGKLSCFAGQSAVGKSSVSNTLTGGENRAVGDLSRKNLRGKNTTTKAEILTVGPNSYIIDTPGFSMLDIHDIPYNELDLYYSEYVERSAGCRYRRCSHTGEPDCAVKKLVESGELNRERYLRYKQMYEELKIGRPY